MAVAVVSIEPPSVIPLGLCIIMDIEREKEKWLVRERVTSEIRSRKGSRGMHHILGGVFSAKRTSSLEGCSRIVKIDKNEATHSCGSIVSQSYCFRSNNSLHR